MRQRAIAMVLDEGALGFGLRVVLAGEIGE